MANRRFTQFFNTLHNRPVLLDCNFTVDVSNVNGLGLSGLKGPGIQNVYLHSTAAFTGTSHTSVLIDSISSTANLAVGMNVQGSGIPAGAKIAKIVSSTSINLSAATSTSTTGSITYQAVGSPNPASGVAIIQLADNYNRFFNGYGSICSPNSGSSILVASAGVVINTLYVITIVGTTSLAGWQSIGLPVGITPAVGVAFVASVTGTVSGTGAVQVPAVAGSGISAIDFVGLPNTTISSSAANVPGISSGAYIVARFLAPAFSGSALGSHTHDFLIKGGQAGSTTNDVAIYAGPVIGKEEAADATILGANSAASGGVVAASAGTPAGSLALAAAAPAAGSLISFGLYVSNSSIIVQGE